MRALAPPPDRLRPARRAAAQLTTDGVSGSLYTKRGDVQRGNDATFQSTYMDWQGWARRYARSISAASFNALVISDMCARCNLQVEQRVNGEWEASDDARFDSLIAMYANPLQETTELIRSHGWHYSVAGEMVSVSRGAPAEWAVYSVSACVWDAPDEGMVTIKLVPDGKIEKDTAFAVPRTQVVRFWMPDQEWQAYAWSPMAAAITDLKRYDALAQYALKTADSAVAMSGLLWGPGEAHQQPTAGVDDEGAESDDAGTPRSRLEEMYYSIASMRHSPSEDVTAIAPPFLHWDKDWGPPEFIKLGEPLDPNGIAYRMEALEDFARATPLPVTSVVGGGVGDANHWSEWLASRKMFDSGVAPTMDRITHQDLTMTFLRPSLVLSGFDPAAVSEYRLGYDPAPVIVNQDNSDNALRAWLAGLISDEPAAEAMGFTVNDLLTEPAKREWLLDVLSHGRGVGGSTPITTPVSKITDATTSQGPPSTANSPLAASARRSRVAQVLSDALARN